MTDYGTDYKTRNPIVFTFIEGLIEKIVYGELKVSFEIHNKRITSIHVYGKKTIKPPKQPMDVRANY
jgi:hypothetical protein